MAKRREARILFFTANALPTPREQDLADRLGSNVGFRVGRMAKGTKPEGCDAVAAAKGEYIPDIYAQANIPRVMSYDDVRKLKPSFTVDIGYKDDEDDYGNVNTEPTLAGEPVAGVPAAAAGEAETGEAEADDKAPAKAKGGKAGKAAAEAGAQAAPVAAPATPPAATEGAGAAPAAPAAAWAMPPIPPEGQQTT